jgi:type IV fimbrial biogenesis protein FimT
MGYIDPRETTTHSITRICRKNSDTQKMHYKSGGRAMRANRISPLTVLSSGFTLIELMVVIGVVGALLALAIPSFRDLSLGSASVAQGNRLLGHLNTARSEAVKSGTNVRITAGGAGWAEGWTVATDRNMDGLITAADGDAVLQIGTKANKGFVLTATTTPGGAAVTELFYTASGTLSTPNAGVLFVIKRPDATDHPERCKRVLVEASGRAEVQKGSLAQCS